MLSELVRQALGTLKWLVVMDALPTTSSEFWRAPGVDSSSVKTEVFMLPTTHWIEKDGSFVNSGRWMQWKDQVLPPEGQSRHDHWLMADLLMRVRALYQQQGGRFPDPIKGQFGNVKRVFGALGNKATHYEPGKELAPGITPMATPGHTPGHTSFVVASGNDKVLLQIDVTAAATL